MLSSIYHSAPGTNRADGQQPMADLDHSPALLDIGRHYFKRVSCGTLFDLYNEPFPDGNHNTTAAWDQYA